MIIVLDNGQRVDSNDAEALEKAAVMLEREVLEAAESEVLDKSAEKGELTSEKAKKILEDGEVHGKPLTEQQRKYFGSVAGGTARKSESISSLEALAGYGLEKAKRSLQAPKEWWDKTIKAVAATPKYKGYKRERLAKIVGDIWANLDDKKKKEIRNRYGKEFGAAKSMDGVEALADFAKAGGPFIGPRGGKWADAAHTIPWDPKKHDKAAKKPAESRAEKVDAAIRAISEKLPEYGKPGIPFKNMTPSEKNAVVLMEQRGHAVIGGQGGVTLTTRGAMERDKAKKKPSKTGIPETEAREKRTAAMQKKLDALPKGTKFRISFKGGGGMKAHTSTVTAQGDGMWKMTTPGWPSTMEHTGDIAHHFVNVGGTGVNAPTSITGTGVEELTGEKPAKKSLTEWLNEQETDMSNETELMKALGEDAELAKSIHMNGQRITEWADQFYSDSGLETQALQCVKDAIACNRKWDAHHKSRKPWKELDNLTRNQRDAYEEKRNQTRDAISKEEDAVRMKMRDLESKLVDYKIKQASVRQAMGKGGVEVDVVKGETGTSVLMAYLEKAEGGPFIGPRGGKWADAKHTIPWSEKRATAGKKQKKPREEADEPAADELTMFIRNDSALHRQMEVPAWKNLANKMADGKYDHAQATKLMNYLATEGAKRYQKEHGGPMPGPATRMAAAKQMADYFHNEAVLGNMDAHLNKKNKKAVGSLKEKKETKKSEEAMSGTEILQDYLEKAQTMPGGEPGVKRGPKDGADLSRKTGPTGSGDSAASVIGAPTAGKKTKLSDDDDDVEAQLKGKKKPIERITGKSLAVPGHQREMVAHENAQVVSRLRKGPDDITVGPGVPTPVVEPEPIRKAESWSQGEEALVVYNDGADEAAARLIKGEDFYAGGEGPTLGRNPMILTQRKVCKACEAVMSKSLAVCPHCGDGAGLKPQGALRIAVSARPGPGLQPTREPDIKIG